MALGTLSSDQARYAQQLTAATGLDPDVVRAWIGAESGWGTYKPGHNYLNIGPGRQYQSVDMAAGAAAQLVDAAPQYAGIRSAIPQGAGAQVSAIGQSPWGTSASSLSQVWQGLVGQHGAGDTVTPSSSAPPATNPVVDLNPLHHLPSLSNLAGGAASAVGLDKVAGTFISGLLSLIFVGGALALIGMGVSRLTGVSARDAFDKANQTAGQVGQVAAMAAM